MNIYYTISAEIRLQTIISARAKLNDTLNSVLKHQQPICLYIILYQHVWDATANSIRLSLLKRPTTPSTHWHILKKVSSGVIMSYPVKLMVSMQKRKLRLGDFGAPKL